MGYKRSQRVFRVIVFRLYPVIVLKGIRSMFWQIHTANVPEQTTFRLSNFSVYSFSVIRSIIRSNALFISRYPISSVFNTVKRIVQYTTFYARLDWSLPMIYLSTIQCEILTFLAVIFLFNSHFFAFFTFGDGFFRFQDDKISLKKAPHI